MIEEVKGANNSAPKPKTEQKNNDLDSVANSIFDKMDTDHDKFVSEQEAKDFGYTTLGDKSLSREDFLKKYREYKDKTGTIDGILNGFREHFEKSSNRSLGRYVELNETQKRELVSRLEMFEATQKIIREDKNYQPEETSYLKDGLSGLMNNDLAEYLEQFSTNRKISDGKIGAFRQGNLSDCYFLSAINNYISTPEGRINIENRIKNNKDGTYSVILQNPFDQTKQEIYTVSDEDLKTKYANGATGDIDVRLLEAAADGYLEKYASEKERFKEKMISNDEIAKLALIHKAFGYKDDVKFFVKESDGKIYSRSTSICQNDDGKAKITIKYDNTDFTSLRDLIKQSNFSEEMLTVGSFPRTRRAAEIINLDMSLETSMLPESHVFNLEKITDDTSIVNNPHRSVFPLALSNENFDKFAQILYYLPTKNIVQ